MNNKPLSQLTPADELAQSDLERAFVTRWRQCSDGAPDPVCEYEFDEDRGYRFDFAWPDHQVAIELQGVRDHATVKGLNRDCEKMNLAQTHGWVVFQATTRMLARDPAGIVEMIVDALGVATVKARNANRARQLANAGVESAACAARRGT